MSGIQEGNATDDDDNSKVVLESSYIIKELLVSNMEIIKQLKILNMHMELITSHEIQKRDV